MYTSIKISLPAIFASALALGCSTDEMQQVDVAEVALSASEESPTQQTTKDVNDYYNVRQDFRKCAYPACGGWYLTHLNHGLMQCPDGNSATECYVPAISLPEGVTLQDGELVHGWFGTQDAFGNEILEADFAYESTLEDPWPFGSHNLVYNNGLVCIQAPCPSTSLAHLNSEYLWFGANTFFWGANDAEDAALQTAFDQEYANDLGQPGGGAITLGSFWYWSGQYYYSIYNVFTEKVAQTPSCVIHDDIQRTTAWSFATRSQAETFSAGVEGSHVVDGNCGEQAPLCPAVIDPVHGGIDANDFVCEVHNNGCEFRAAILRAAATNKATGTWRAGGSCDEE